jgi:hypothetical protein
MLHSNYKSEKPNPLLKQQSHIYDIESKSKYKLDQSEFTVTQILDSNRVALWDKVYNFKTKKVDFVIPMLFDEKIYEEVHKFYNNSDILVSYSKAPDYKFLEAILYNFITKDKKIINYKSKIALRSVTWLKDSLFIYGLFTGNNAPGGVKWSILTFKSLTGIDEHQTITEIYPNPSNKIITIGGLPIDETIKIMIKSISGNLLKDEIKNTGEGSIVIEISDFPIGTYIININGQNFNASYKVIKGE